jgi:hypothetical protein
MDTMKQTDDTVGVTVAGNNRSGREAIKKIEQATSAIPSAAWLALGGGAIVGAIVLKAMGRDTGANFVGLWLPTILMLGLYNKMVKLMGSDRKAERVG